jgi:hypothetical protein
LIAFGATRTIHRTTSSIEAAGFEIRDMISWVYFSGFPKSLNISKAIDSTILSGSSHSTSLRQTELEHGHTSYTITSPQNGILGDKKTYERKRMETQTEQAKEWKGWGTALKPAQEPAVLARKPIEQSSIAKQVLDTGTAGINIDASRFGYGDPCWVGPNTEQMGHHKKGSPIVRSKTNFTVPIVPIGYTCEAHPLGRWPANIFQCPKPSRTEKEQGLEHLKQKPKRSSMNTFNGEGERFDGQPTPELANFHPTVKPLKLMRWLCKLITPPEGVILDPFCGSGTTVAAAILEGFDSIGMELTEDYLPIIQGRAAWAIEEYKRENAQLSFYDWLEG